MIEASGDSLHMGRTIDDSFESAITLALATALKQALEQRAPRAKIILNRGTGQILTPLQNAHVANKLAIDCYISLHAFLETESPPRLYLYQFNYADTIIIKQNPLGFYACDTVYLLNQNQTAAWAQKMSESLKTDQSVMVNGAYKIPCKPLLGIQAPAIMIEIGLKTKDDWQCYVEPLVQSLALIMG